MEIISDSSTKSPVGVTISHHVITKLCMYKCTHMPIFSASSLNDNIVLFDGDFPDVVTSTMTWNQDQFFRGHCFTMPREMAVDAGATSYCHSLVMPHFSREFLPYPNYSNHIAIGKKNRTDNTQKSRMYFTE